MPSPSRLLFIDSGVLLAAARGDGDLSERALRILGERHARFASSDFVRLEVLPKATYNRRTKEVQFYQEFFDAVVAWAPMSPDIVQTALREAVHVGLGPMDALHVAAAALLGADEFITTEGSTKPLHRTKLIPVKTIHPDV